MHTVHGSPVYRRQLTDGVVFGQQVRRALGDFGVLIAILAMSLLDFAMKDTYTQVSVLFAGQVSGHLAF